MATSGLSLPDWLRRLETLSVHEIELGLERVLDVLERMSPALPERVIHVAGTNGKGSSVAMLYGFLSRLHRRVGTYTSPHVIRYNERICVDGRPASDAAIIAAFERVESARRGVPLTYFEFGTLAAVAVFEAAAVDAAVLEIGMGGRLDAVNVIEPDAGLITNVSLDHCEWLGSDVESIGFEKAGIMRRGKPVVFADRNVPASVRRHAEAVGAGLLLAGHDYDWSIGERHRWSWRGQRHELSGLAPPSLAGSIQVQNAAGVLAVLEALGCDRLFGNDIVDGVLGVLQLPGRMQSVQREREWLFDVAHNPAAAAALGATLREQGRQGLVAVVGVLDDKDVEGIVAPLKDLVEQWIAVTAASPRAIDGAELARRVANAADCACLIAGSMDAAVSAAREFASAGGCILVTGSFYVVGPMLQRLSAPD